MTTNAQTKTKDWARELVNLYSEGYSDAEVASEMKITTKEYHRQIDDNPVS